MKKLSFCPVESQNRVSLATRNKLFPKVALMWKRCNKNINDTILELCMPEKKSCLVSYRVSWSKIMKNFSPNSFLKKGWKSVKTYEVCIHIYLCMLWTPSFYVSCRVSWQRPSYNYSLVSKAFLEKVKKVEKTHKLCIIKISEFRTKLINNSWEIQANKRTERPTDR